MKIEFHENSPLNIELIQNTFEAAYNKPFNKKNWVWRFVDNPFAEQVKIAYIVDNGKLAGYYAVNPIEISIDNSIQRAALSLMTMTHPEYTNQGLFKKLAATLFEKLKSEDYIAIYGFANYNSHYGFRKYLGWKDIMPLYNLRAIEVKSMKGSFDIEQGSVNHNILERFSKLSHTSRKVSLTRDLQFLNYRILNNPIYSYQYCALKKGQKIETGVLYKIYNNQIDIMEVFYLNQEKYFESLWILLSFLNKKYCQNINIWSNYNTIEHIELEKIGFKISEFNSFFGVIPLMDCPILNEYKNWHIRFIDSDIF